MKKGFMLVMAFALFVTLGFGMADTADAKRGGAKSSKKSYTQTTPKQDSTSGATQSSTGTKATGTGTGAAATTKSGGLFGGSSLMKGLMIGGLAGMLFGSMFSGMGAFGEILGLMVNLLAIFAVIMVIRAAFVYIKSKKNTNHNNPETRRPY